MVNAEASGTQAATINTEHTLRDVNAAGVYTLHVDTVNMAAADTLELRVYQMALTGGTRRVLDGFPLTYTNAQTGVEIKITLPVGNELTDAGALRFTLKQTAGTGRNFPWKVLKYV